MEKAPTPVVFGQELPRVLGVDLGQAHDYTGITALGFDRYRTEAQRENDRRWMEYMAALDDPHMDRHDYQATTNAWEERFEGGEDYSPEPNFEVVLLERRQESYVKIVERVGKIVEAAGGQDRVDIIIDATGVGAAVADIFWDQGIPVTKAMITSGTRAHWEHRIQYIPKADLIGKANKLLQQRRVKIASGLKEAQVLQDEIRNYRYQITTNRSQTFGPWRASQHDDVLFSLCLALWRADSMPLAGVDPTLWFHPDDSDGWFGPVDKPPFS